MVLGGGSMQTLFQKVKIMVRGVKKLKEVARQNLRLKKSSDQAANGLNNLLGSLGETKDEAEGSSEMFGKFFGIGMNVMFLGMALGQVFGGMARSMLKMTGAGAALASSLKIVLLPFFQAITPLLLDLANRLMNLPRSIKMVIGGFVALMAVLGPLMMIIGQLILLFVSGLSVGMLVTALGVAAGALAILAAGFKLGMELGKRFGDEIRFAMNVVETILTRVISTSINSFKNFMTILSEVVGFFSNIVRGDFKAAAGNLKTIFVTMIDNIRQILRMFFLTDLAQLIAQTSSLVLDKAVNIGKSIIEGVVNGIKSVGDNIADAFFSVLPAPLSAALKGVSGMAGGLAGGLRNVLTPNDFILTSGGKMIQPDQNDTIVGFNGNGPIQPGGGGEVTVNINDPVMKEDIDVQRVVDEVEDRVNRDARGRSGGLGR